MAAFNKQQHYLFLLGGLTIVLGGISAATGVEGAGGGGGGRGSGMYSSYGQSSSSSSSSISGLGMRRSAGAYGPPHGLGNPHDGPRYLLPPGLGGGPASGPSSGRATGPPSGKSGGHHRLSAWGIITIVTFVILIGAGAYWGFICYPFFCKKERQYNMMMNMSTATTATPSTRSTEFEKLDHCCSKSTTSTRSNDTGISNI